MAALSGIVAVIDRVRKTPTFSTLLVFASASMLSTLVSGVGGILQARWIDPETLGQFTKYSILTSYLSVCLVMVQDGLSRQFPFLIGQGRRDEAIRVASVAKTWYLVAMSIFCVLFAGLSAWSLFRGCRLAAIGWATQIPISVALSYGVFLQTIYRRSMEFKRLSYNGVISSVIGFISLVFVRLWGFAGLSLKSLFYHSVRVFLDARYVPVRIHPSWDYRTFCGLAKISVPLSLEGYIRTSFFSATFGYLVVSRCGARDLGLFGIAAAFEGFGMVFVNALIQIFDVKIANKYGKDESLKNGMRYLVTPTVLGFLCSLVVAALLCVVVGPFIRAFVPKYASAIPIVYVMSSAMPVSVLLIPTRLLRTALMYKSVFCLALARVVSLVALVQFVPRRIEWYAGCRVAAELIAVILGYALIFVLIRKTADKEEDVNA